ncbi:autophagy protein ATG13 [Phlyctema vagabunda]|uniref:Autophagy-related protein 13 n=1 Tax=Phlyctema vagabunda TaxID=108571 RepID=A0ABR4PFB4_9HELO
MHQHPRPSPITASPASSPRTNPMRTNNSREEGFGSRPRTNSDLAGYNESEEAGDVSMTEGPSQEAVRKLDQIIQNFHVKAAIVILQSRITLPVVFTADGPKKVNKWFQIETDDTNAFRQELKLWKTCSGFDNRPPPLIIETYLDTSDLTRNQSLVIVDDEGKRWDVQEALNNANVSSDGSTHQQKRGSEVILERWKIELKESPEGPYDFGSTLPTVYKKCIIFFRALYTTAKFVPGWKFVKSLGKNRSANAAQLRVNCRVLPGELQPTRSDALTLPLYETQSPVTTDYSFGATDTPAGQISAIVSFRNDCNFRIDDSEALLSSRFMGADEHFFQPSLAAKNDNRRRNAKTEVGSLPASRQPLDDPEPGQAYGSMSTFHGNGAPLASSPISALRAAKVMGSEDGSSLGESAPRARPMQTSRASLKSLEGVNMARRPSFSFQPFKAGSLSSSPGRGSPLHLGGEGLPTQSPQSLPRASGISALAQARNRSSLTAGMPASLRGGPSVPENATISTSSSPKPAPISRYSSSFTHRRGRSSFGGASKLDDDQTSSGKQSFSSVQPGSGILAEPSGGSSGSLQTDDDNISEFLKLLDSKKTLTSFEPSGEGSTKRTTTQLSRFQMMRDSNNALTESMSSSTALHRSSSSSSRQLSSVPPMVAATSMSVSSSPGKPVSPHTPHTPAIPSRLSANSVVEYSQTYSHSRRLSHRSREAPESRLEDVVDDDSTNELGTNAIDIPTSPRPYYPHARRSSSVAQRHRSVAVDDDLGDLPFGPHRSISLGADDRQPPSLSALLGLGSAAENTASGSSPSPSILQPAPHISEESTPMSRQPSSSLDGQDSEIQQVPRGFSAGSTNSPYRPRIGRTGGRGVTPPQTGSSSSLVERGSGSGTSERGAGRYSFTRATGNYEADDEPLLFDMSEVHQSRRSIEEARGGGNLGDNTRGGDSGSSSRRGSRRGW